MHLPKLKVGQRPAISKPTGSGDALVLAQLAQQRLGQGAAPAANPLTKASSGSPEPHGITVIICADAADAQRLLGEIPFFAPELRCTLFPDWETLPYDNFSPHQDLISERLATLWRIKNNDTDVVIMPATTALYRLAPPSFLAAYTFHFEQKQQLAEDKLKAQLTLAGYHHVTQVMSPGEYAVRGGLIDLFPMGSVMPYRIDLFDDVIDSIRSFDPDTQRSIYPVQQLRLLPGREFPLDEAAQQMFRNRWRDMLEGDPTKSRIYKDMGSGIATAGIEYYLPLFFESTATVFDYLGPSACVVLHGDLEAPLTQFWRDASERHRLLRGDPDRPALAPEHLFLPVDTFFNETKRYPALSVRVNVGTDAGASAGTGTAGATGAASMTALPDVAANRTAQEPLAKLKAYLDQGAQRTLILAQSAGRRESLLDTLRASNISPVVFESLAQFQASDERLGITTSALASGFAWRVPASSSGTSTGAAPAQVIAFLTETELFASGAVQRRSHRNQEKTTDLDALIKDLSQVNVGDPVVHASHGVGRYRGLVHLDLGPSSRASSASDEADNNNQQEFLHLEYANEAVLYVPVAQLHLISRYTGVSPDEAPLHRLGSDQWSKARRKAAQQVRDSAAELLNIYARRATREGFAFRFEPHDYEVFAADFGFDETPDQQAAIQAVMQDMISPRPMDRLVCGDVGFGKTEVALRAAFIAVQGGKQVAFLAPTTLLAEQHYQTLVDRFARWPVRIAEMSRFRTKKEVAAAQIGISDGTLDIVVGTHQLLSKDTHFKDLGLLIIDEEHRFGVRHKEAMKALRAQVDVLTLTATPIPRTLGMAMEGLRDLSVIATAPQRRLAIKTFVRSEDRGVMREALLREIKRGGQCYFLHNDVATMQNRLASLTELLPEAHIQIAHGQMPERELERVMRDFVAQRFNVLLCSTIIETGIDVPSANTIVISHADKFGLAQLHQLRGRVGRSHHQAYAYLLVPDVQSLGKSAQARLEAIAGMEELGSGFYLAMHDLEIRGAGEVLGEKQSGNMLEVGFQLYNDMLSQAVRALKSGQEPDLMRPLHSSVEINLHTPALLPKDYCGDVHLRLSFYKKFATAKNDDAINTLLEELVDRFGKLPGAAQALIDTHRLRVLSEPYGVHKIDATAQLIVITFKPDAPIDSRSIISLIQRNRHIKLAGNEKLRIEKAIEQPTDRAHMVRDVLRSLQRL